MRLPERPAGCARTNRLVLGHEATAEKSSEITAIPKLLELLELKGCIVTIDAMGYQRAIAEQIVAQGGDYVLGLKGNQSNLPEAVEDFFAVAQKASFAHVRHDCAEALDKDHGRMEIRRYCINTIRADAQRFAHGVRGHWGSKTACTGAWTSSSAMTPAASARATRRRS